jgi:16S rRNA processing protein RimM
LNNNGVISIGKITAPHGVNGAVKIHSYAESPSVFKDGMAILVKNPEDSTVKKYKLNRAASHSRYVIIQLDGIDSRHLAEKIKGFELFIYKSDIPRLEEDTYYWSDIIGLSVYSSEGLLVGRVDSVIPTGANDVYVVKNEKNEEILIPAIGSVVSDIDIVKKKMKVNLPEGL